MMDADDVAEIYRIDKSKIQHIEKHKRPEPDEIVYIVFPGDPDTRKRYAWRFAEELIRHGKAKLSN